MDTSSRLRPFTHPKNNWLAPRWRASRRRVDIPKVHPLLHLHRQRPYVQSRYDGNAQVELVQNVPVADTWILHMASSSWHIADSSSESRTCKLSQLSTLFGHPLINLRSGRRSITGILYQRRSSQSSENEANVESRQTAFSVRPWIRPRDSNR